MLRLLTFNGINFCLALVLGILCFSAPLKAASFKVPKPAYVTGGTIMFPYSLQPGDRNNVYFETFIKASFPLWKSKKSKLSVFVKGFYSKDSQALTFNNRSKASVGISYSHKLHKTFSITATAKYDYDYRPLSSKTKSGLRANLSYFYYKSWWRNMPGGHKGWFRQKSWARAWGVFTYPESLDAGNHNLAFITGLEAATAFVRPKGKLQYVPFAELTFARDSYKLSFNNKVIPAAGFKFRYPLKGGEINLGVKYAIDRRWINGTTEYGTVIFAGWYKSF
ncbi:MAG: hypothetical protein QM492_06865 [Rhodobacterales bacterium]